VSPAQRAALAAKFPEVAKQFNPSGPIYEDALLREEAAAEPKPAAIPQEPMPAAIVEMPATAPLIAVNLESPLAGALKQAARGIPQTPLSGKKPFQKDWQNKATTDAAQIQKWAEENPGCNFGSVAKGVIGGFWMLELDAPGEAARIRNETGNQIPVTLLVRSRPGRGHLYWKQTPASIAMGNIGQDGVQGAGFSVRVHNEQCVSPGAIHPISGLPYSILDDAEIVEAPDWLIQWIEKQRQVVKKDPAKSLDSILKNKLTIPEGERNTKLHKIGSKFRGAGVSEDGILEELHRVNEEQCDGDLPKEEIESIWRSVCGYAAGDPTKDPQDDIIINKTPDPSKTQPASIRPEWANNLGDELAPASVGGEPEPGENTHPLYDMTEEEIASQKEAKCPVYRLYPTAGPEFDNNILYGALGFIAKKACEFSEAHTGSVYLSLIVAMGNMFGRSAYFNVGSSKHYTNEYVAFVGISAKGRKGLASDIVEATIGQFDSGWVDGRTMGGFSTNQAVISQIKDASSFQKLQKDGTYKTIQQPGISDKRLCIWEGEISNVFKLLANSKEKAAETIRNAWDGKPVNNLVAGKSDDGEHNSLLCKNPHISIVGSTTPFLAKTTLPVGVGKSGDGNRFIWCYTKRHQLVPRPPEPIAWEQETIERGGQKVNLLEYMLDVVRHGKNGGVPRLIPLTKPADKFWDDIYLRLENDTRADFLGDMTSRGAPHIRRIAMILALCDMESAIRVDHLRAAEAIWNYSQESAQYIFTGCSLDQAKILRAAESAGMAGLTATDIHKLFSRNKSGAWVRAQVKDLVANDSLAPMIESGNGRPGSRFQFRKWPKFG
jgi:hypothetical protein